MTAAPSKKTVHRSGCEPVAYTPKQTAYRNKEFSAAICSIGICAMCGSVTAVTHCHSNQSKYGKGGAKKSSDAAQLAGCAICHSWLDQGKARQAVKVEAEERGIIRTYQTLRELGLICGEFPQDETAENFIRSMELGAIYLREDWRKL